MMVHHGGAGTTHAALRAGVPAVVVPFILEQQLWANRLRAAGGSVQSVPFWNARVEQLAGRVREEAGSQSLQARAEALGAELVEEDGALRAAELLQRLVAE